MSQPPVQGFVKDPDANLPFAIDWAAALPSGETIASVLWTVPAGLTLVSQSNTSTVATGRFSSGTIGTSYRVECRITTTPTSYIDVRSIEIEIVER